MVTASATAFAFLATAFAAFWVWIAEYTPPSMATAPMISEV